MWCNIRWGLHALDVSCAIQLDHQSHGHSASARQQWFSPKKASARRHLSWTIALVQPCTYFSGYIGSGQVTIPMACSNHPTVVTLCLPPLTLSWTQWTTDVGCGLLKSFVACTFLNRHHPFNVFIVRGFCKSLCCLRAWIAYITLGIQTTLRRHWSFLAPITFIQRTSIT